jgi:hypothetical protein
MSRCRRFLLGFLVLVFRRGAMGAVGADGRQSV